MKGKLGSDIEGYTKRSSDLNNKQVYLPYDIQLFSILNNVTYSSIQKQFTVLCLDIMGRKEIVKELIETVKKLQLSNSETVNDNKFIFTMRSD
jgi:hypothetical protein